MPPQQASLSAYVEQLQGWHPTADPARLVTVADVMDAVQNINITADNLTIDVTSLETRLDTLIDEVRMLRGTVPDATVRNLDEVWAALSTIAGHLATLIDPTDYTNYTQLTNIIAALSDVNTTVAAGTSTTTAAIGQTTKAVRTAVDEVADFHKTFRATEFCCTAETEQQKIIDDDPDTALAHSTEHCQRAQWLVASLTLFLKDVETLATNGELGATAITSLYNQRIGIVPDSVQVDLLLEAAGVLAAVDPVDNLICRRAEWIVVELFREAVLRQAVLGAEQALNLQMLLFNILSGLVALLVGVSGVGAVGVAAAVALINFFVDAVEDGILDQVLPDYQSIENDLICAIYTSTSGAELKTNWKAAVDAATIYAQNKLIFKTLIDLFSDAQWDSIMSQLDTSGMMASFDCSTCGTAGRSAPASISEATTAWDTSTTAAICALYKAPTTDVAMTDYRAVFAEFDDNVYALLSRLVSAQLLNALWAGTLPSDPADLAAFDPAGCSDCDDIPSGTYVVPSRLSYEWSGGRYAPDWEAAGFGTIEPGNPYTDPGGEWRILKMENLGGCTVLVDTDNVIHADSSPDGANWTTLGAGDHSGGKQYTIPAGHVYLSMIAGISNPNFTTTLIVP